MKLKDFIELIKGKVIVKVFSTTNMLFLFEGYLEALKLSSNINLIYDMEVVVCLVNENVLSIMVK